jgi:hypothetical protein
MGYYRLGYYFRNKAQQFQIAYFVYQIDLYLTKKVDYDELYMILYVVLNKYLA